MTSTLKKVLFGGLVSAALAGSALGSFNPKLDESTNWNSYYSVEQDSQVSSYNSKTNQLENIAGNQVNEQPLSLFNKLLGLVILGGSVWSTVAGFISAYKESHPAGYTWYKTDLGPGMGCIWTNTKPKDYKGKTK